MSVTPESARLFDQSKREWANTFAPDLIEQPSERHPGLNVVLLGTFRNWPAIRQTRQHMTALGFHVMAPQGEEIVEGGNFALLDADIPRLASIEERVGRPLDTFEKGCIIEALFLEAILRSDICYIVVHDQGLEDGGYFGQTVAGETGFAEGAGKVVVASMLISPTLDEREGMGSNFPYYAPAIPVMSSEELRDHFNWTGAV